jgi:hypothetical protein
MLRKWKVLTFNSREKLNAVTLVTTMGTLLKRHVIASHLFARLERPVLWNSLIGRGFIYCRAMGAHVKSARMSVTETPRELLAGHLPLCNEHLPL